MEDSETKQDAGVGEGRYSPISCLDLRHLVRLLGCLFWGNRGWCACWGWLGLEEDMRCDGPA